MEQMAETTASESEIEPGEPSSKDTVSLWWQAVSSWIVGIAETTASEPKMESMKKWNVQ